MKFQISFLNIGVANFSEAPSKRDKLPTTIVHYFQTGMTHSKESLSEYQNQAFLGKQLPIKAFNVAHHFVSGWSLLTPMYNI